MSMKLGYALALMAAGAIAARPDAFRDEPQQYRAPAKPKQSADPVKKAARKRQKQARAKSRRAS